MGAYIAGLIDDIVISLSGKCSSDCCGSRCSCDYDTSDSRIDFMTMITG